MTLNMGSIQISEKLELRLVTISDIDSLFELIKKNKTFFKKFDSSVASINTKDELRQKIELIENNKGYSFCLFCEGHHAGLFSINSIEIKSQTANIGYWFGEEFGGKGFAAEAILALIHFCFNELNLKHIEATTATTNFSSIKLLKKVGFIEENILKNAFKIGDRYIDDYLFRISNQKHLSKNS